jgi:hypothetical protein
VFQGLEFGSDSMLFLFALILVVHKRARSGSLLFGTPYGYEVLTADHLEYYKAKGLVETIMDSSKKKDRIIRRRAKTKRLCFHGVNHWKTHVMTSLLQPAIFF